MLNKVRQKFAQRQDEEKIEHLNSLKGLLIIRRRARRIVLNSERIVGSINLFEISRDLHANVASSYGTRIENKWRHKKWGPWWPPVVKNAPEKRKKKTTRVRECFVRTLFVNKTVLNKIYLPWKKILRMESKRFDETSFLEEKRPPKVEYPSFIHIPSLFHSNFI